MSYFETLHNTDNPFPLPTPTNLRLIGTYSKKLKNENIGTEITKLI